MAINIEFKADLDHLIQGVRDGKVSLDDLNGYIDELGKTGEDAGQQASDGIDEVGSAADDSGDKLGKLGEAGKQALSGDVSGAAESAAGALFALGPIAGAAGAVASQGINLIKGAFEAADKKREELEKNAAKLAAAYIEAGQTVLDSMTVTKNVTDILTDPEQKKAADDLVKTLGVDLPQAVLLLAGSQDALNQQDAVQETRQARINELLSIRQAVLSNLADPSTFGVAQGDELNRLLDQGKAWDTFLTTHETAVKLFNDSSDALLLMIQQAGTAKEEVDDLGNRLPTLPGADGQDGMKIFIDADTGKASQSLDQFRGDIDGFIRDISTDPVQLQLELLPPKTRAVLEALQSELDRNPVKASFNLGSYGRYQP